MKYESLHNELENAIALNILKVQDEVFYGIGYGPSGDGYQVKSAYTFDMLASHFNVNEENNQAYITAIEYPVGENIWYVYQQYESCQLSRIDYQTLSEEILLYNQPKLDFLGARSFGVDSQYVYYTKDNSIFRQNFATGSIEKLVDHIGEVKKLFVSHDKLFIDKQSMCLSIDLLSGDIGECFQGQILGLSDLFIYFMENNEDGTMIKTYNIETGDIASKLQLAFKLMENATMQNNRYIIDLQDSHYICVLDIQIGIVYNIDVQAMIELVGRKADIWYVDDNNLYAQFICEWDLGEEKPDQFYKWNWKQ